MNQANSDGVGSGEPLDSLGLVTSGLVSLPFSGSGCRSANPERGVGGDVREFAVTREPGSGVSCFGIELSSPSSSLLNESYQPWAHSSSCCGVYLSFALLPSIRAPLDKSSEWRVLGLGVAIFKDPGT